MKSILALYLLLSGCAHASASGVAPSHDPLANALHYAVSLTRPSGEVYCSGSIVGGAVLTAGHCVVGQGDIRVSWLGETFRPWGHSDYPEQDTSILFIEGLPEGLHLAEAAPRYGALVYIVGNPLGILERNLSTGHVAHPRRELDLGCDRHTCFPNPHLMVDAVIAGGSSGSPVLNEVGHVVGVISFGFGRSWSPGGAVHLDTLKSIAERNKSWNG